VVDYLAGQPNERTWYENALVEGLIIPFVRTQNVSGFYELWDHMFKSSLQGHYEKSEHAAKRLDKLGGLAKPEYWKPWPDGMGIRFANLVDNRLLRRDPNSMIPVNLRGNDFDNCAGYLERTKIFRIDDVELAQQQIPREDGLRVSEILYASSRRLLGRKVNNIEGLLDGMEKNSAFSAQDVADAKQFYKTLIELYNENLANAMSATNSVTDFDVATRIFSEGGNADLFTEEELSGPPIFEDIELPPIPLLKTLNFDIVLACRGSGEFAEYQRALETWTRNSKESTTKDNVTKSVRAYAKKIQALCRHDHRYFDQYRVTVSYKPAALRLGGRLLAFTAAGAGEYAVHEKLMEQAGDFAMAFSNVSPVVSATVAASATAVAGGLIAANTIESGIEKLQHTGTHWLYISKLRKQKATLVARANSSVEVHDSARPFVRAQIAK
jgi:hypothetical protein